MPPLIALLPTIASIAGIAGTGISLGETLSHAGGGAPAAPTAPKPTPPDANALAQQRALVSQQLPNVVGQTSGLANPDYDALMAKILSGVLGQPGANAAGNAATGQAFSAANSQPTNPVTGNVNLSDFINTSA